MAIRDEVVEILTKKAAKVFRVDPANLNENTHFENDLGAKSAHIVQLSAALEDEFEIEVPLMIFKTSPTFGGVGEWLAAEFGE
jgi:acyl carrier protein